MVPRVGFAHALDALHRGRLARAVGPDQAEDLAFEDFERSFVDGHGFAVGLADAGDLNDWRHGRSVQCTWPRRACGRCCQAEAGLFLLRRIVR